MSDVRAAASKLAARVHEEKASRSVVERLQTAQRGVEEQLSALTAVVACKMDRVDLAHLEATAEKLADFGAHTAAVDERLEALEGGQAALTAAMAGAAEERAALAADGRGTRVVLSRKAEKTEVTTVNDALAAVQQRVVMLSTSQAARNLSFAAGLTRLSALEESVAKGRESERASSRTALARVEARLMAALEEKAEAAWAAGKFVEVARALDAAAEQSALVDVAAALKVVQSDVRQLERESRVALRFVEWFSDRGEAYEHNFGVVDRALKGLASHPSEREPYDGSVVGEGGGRAGKRDGAASAAALAAVAAPGVLC
eukprot:PLAT12511.14.p2 GENE.PLAT12511.14~~PLAT12511.14.p2  ORF type:complete len:317 (+),score=138.52 PLAT12511.14:654-1604(+)